MESCKGFKKEYRGYTYIITVESTGEICEWLGTEIKKAYVSQVERGLDYKFDCDEGWSIYDIIDYALTGDNKSLMTFKESEAMF